MSQASRRVDPDGELRVLYAAVLLCLGIGVAVAYVPLAGLGLAAVVAVGALAVGLHLRTNLTPLWPLVVMAALLPLNGLRPLSFVSVGDIVLVLVGTFVLLLLRRAVVPTHVMMMFIGTLVVTAGGVVGMMVAQDWGAVGELAKYVFGAPLVILIVMLIDPDERLAVLLATAYACGAAVSTVAAFFEPVDPEFGRSAGWGAHAGHLALAGILGCFVMIGWVILARHLLVRILAAVAAGLCLYGILLSGTRSALLGFACGVVFLAVAAGLRGLLLMAGGGVGLVAFYLLLVPYLPFKNNIQRAFGQGELAGSSSFTTSLHAEALQDALRLIGRHPWSGVGFAEGQTAHNMVLQVASLGGLLALLGLVIVWFPIVALAISRLAEGMHRDNVMCLCLMAGVIGYFVFAQFQPLIWDRHLWFFIAIAVYAQVRRGSRSARSTSEKEWSDAQPVRAW